MTTQVKRSAKQPMGVFGCFGFDVKTTNFDPIEVSNDTITVFLGHKIVILTDGQINTRIQVVTIEDPKVQIKDYLVETGKTFTEKDGFLVDGVQHIISGERMS